MSYQYLETTLSKSLTFEAFGTSLEGLFLSAAEGLLGVMVADIDAVRGKDQQIMHLEDRSLDLLLFRFLQEIVFLKNARGILVQITGLRREEQRGMHRLSVRYRTGAVDDEKTVLKSQVSGVSLEGLHVGQTGGVWKAIVTLET